MDNRVYYGEYSLRYWIRLILSRDIILPDYQRSFVWSEKDIERLMKHSFEEGQFVQPVTIGLRDDGQAKPVNYILDGQQRLTSILLTYIGWAPIMSKFGRADTVADEDDSAADEDGAQPNGPIKWTFNKILSDDPNENTVERIIERVKSDGKYKKLDFHLDSNFDFDKVFLGFSYVVPNSKDGSVIDKGYAKMFRNLNYFGRHLSTLESRRSLYYMNKEYKPYFDGLTQEGNNVLGDLTIFENMQMSKIDFVRYLAMLSQYLAKDNVNEVLKRYSAFSSRESYYADYVSYLLELDQEANEDKFDGFSFNATFPNDCWKERFEALHDAVVLFKPHMEFAKDSSLPSWIDADYWLFGLMYYLVFRGKSLNEDIDMLYVTIKKAIRNKKKDTYYQKNPNRLGNLRDRLADSIEIYKKYVH